MPRVSIAAPTQAAADAGAVVASAGGNALDASVAAVLVAMSTELGVIAPGASGFITVWPAAGDPVVIDAYAEMPGRGLPRSRFGSGGWTVSMGYGGGMETIIGWGSVAAPGAFAGLTEAHGAFGVAPWEELFQPAIETVERGFPLSPACGEYLDHSHDVIFGWDAESRRVVQPGGVPLTTGDTVRIAGLADTLRELAASPRSLYTGDLAARAVAAAGAADGILTPEDLASYEPVWRAPAMVSVDEWSVATNPAPAVGGVTMVAMLLLMKAHVLDAWDTDALQRYAAVQRAVMEFRREHLDHHDHRTEHAFELLSLARAGDTGALSSPSTIHISAVDDDGTAVAITLSAGYGSGAMIPGSGFWMNNSLGEVELIAEGFHALEPGTRLSSNMAPTVARRPDGSALAIGSPGADRITTAIATVLINHLHLGMPLDEAIAHPRMHVEATGDRPLIAFEPGLDVRPVDQFEVRPFDDRSMFFGGVTAAEWSPARGVSGAADARRSGGIAIAGER